MDLLASCSDVVKIWETKNDQLKSNVEIETSNGVTNSCCWTVRGHRLITVGKHGHINVFRRNGVRVEHRLYCAVNEPLHAVTISPSSNIIAAGGDAGVVEVWHGMEKIRTRMHGSSITCLRFLNSDYRIAAGNEAGQVLLHNLKKDPFDEAPVPLPSFGSHATVTNMAVKPGDPTLIGVTHSDGAVRFWETETGYCNRDMERKNNRAIMDIGFNPKEPSFVVTVGSDGWVRYFDVRTKEREDHSTKLTHAGVPLTCLSFHEEGQRLAVGASNGSVKLIDIRVPSKPIKSEIAYAGPSPPRGGVRGIAFLRTGPSTGEPINLCSSSGSSETYSHCSRDSVSSRSSKGNSGAVSPAVSGKQAGVEKSPISRSTRRVSEGESEAMGDKDYRKRDGNGSRPRSQHPEHRLHVNPERNVVAPKYQFGCGRQVQDDNRDDDGGIRITEEGASRSPSGSASSTRRQQRRYQRTAINGDPENASLSTREAHQSEGCHIDRVHVQQVDEGTSADYRRRNSGAVSPAVSGKQAGVEKSPISRSTRRVSEGESEAMGDKDYRKKDGSGIRPRSQRAEHRLLVNPERNVVVPKYEFGCGRQGQDEYRDDGSIRITEEGASRSPSGSASSTRRQQRRYQRMAINGDPENASLSTREAHQSEECHIDRIHVQQVDEGTSADNRRRNPGAVSPAVSGKQAGVENSPISRSTRRVSEGESEAMGDKGYKKGVGNGSHPRSQRAEHRLLVNPERNVVVPKYEFGCGRQGQDEYRDDDGGIRITEEGASRSPSGSASSTRRQQRRYQRMAINGDPENASLSTRKAHQSEECHIDRIHAQQVDAGTSADYRGRNSGAVSPAVSGKQAGVENSPISRSTRRVSEGESEAMGDKGYKKGVGNGSHPRSQRAKHRLLVNPERNVVAPKYQFGCGRQGQDKYRDDGSIRITEEGASRSPSGSTSSTRRQQRRYQRTAINGDPENASLSTRKTHESEECHIDRVHVQQVDEGTSADYRRRNSGAVSPAVSGKQTGVENSPISRSTRRVSEGESEAMGDKDYRKKDGSGIRPRSQRAEHRLLVNPERNVVAPKYQFGCGRQGQDEYRDDGSIRITEEGASRSPSGSASSTRRQQRRYQRMAINGDPENASLSTRKAHQSEECHIDRVHVQQVDEGTSADYRRSNSCPRESTDMLGSPIFLRNMLEDLFSSHIGAFREEVQREVSQLNVGIRRQLHLLQEEQTAFITNYEERFAALLEENRMMRAENARLRREVH